MYKRQGLFGKNPFWGIGVITYKDLTSKTPSVNTTNETNRQLGDAESKFFGHFRKIIGLLIPVSYTHLDVYKRQPYPPEGVFAKQTTDLPFYNRAVWTGCI